MALEDLERREPWRRIVFPLDVPAASEAQHWVEELAGCVGVFKVGLELFIRCGPGIVAWIRERAAGGVFLDLKLHDIPHTVGRAMRAIAAGGARWATVHCGENPAMLRAAVEGAAGRVGVLAVTVLTSVSAEHLREAGFEAAWAENPERLVLERARRAREAGCAGVVCSGREAAWVRRAIPRPFLIVTPGIRPGGAAPADDQVRVASAAAAVAAGADYLVIGRPIREAPDPRAAARAIAAEIAAAEAGARGAPGAHQG